MDNFYRINILIFLLNVLIFWLGNLFDFLVYHCKLLLKIVLPLYYIHKSSECYNYYIIYTNLKIHNNKFISHYNQSNICQHCTTFSKLYVILLKNVKAIHLINLKAFIWIIILAIKACLPYKNMQTMNSILKLVYKILWIHYHKQK